jgi:hypothetical protein
MQTQERVVPERHKPDTPYVRGLKKALAIANQPSSLDTVRDALYREIAAARGR